MYSFYHVKIWITVKFLCITKTVILNYIIKVILSEIVFMFPIRKTGIHIHTQAWTILFKFLVAFFLFVGLQMVISAGFYSTELWNLSQYSVNKKTTLEH